MVRRFERVRLVLLLIALPFLAFGQSERSKAIKKDYDGKTEVMAIHQYGPLLVSKSTDGKVHLSVEIIASAKDEADLQVLFDHFDILASEEGDRVKFETQFQSENWNTINGKTTIKFKDGKKVSGIKDLRVNMALQVPDLQELRLENKYEKIELANDFGGDLYVKIYSGDFTTQNVDGAMNLDMKYAKAYLKNVGKAAGFEIYDSHLNTGTLAGDVGLKSKYSDISLGDVGGKLALATYDDKVKVGTVTGKLTLSDKYSEFEMSGFGDANLDVYNTKFTVEKGGDLNLNDSKYTKFKIKELGSLNWRDSYDDDVEIEQIKVLTVGKSKYTEYRVGALGQFFSIGESYNDKVTLDEVAANFKSITLDGKYTELSMNIVEGGEFAVSAKMKYGKFDYPERLLNIQMQKEKDSDILITGYVGREQKASENTISITGYDCTVYWR